MVAFAGHARGQVGQQVQARAAHVVQGDVALERAVVLVPLEDIAEIADARGGQGLHRAGRQRVDADVLLAQVHRQIAHAGLQRRLGHAHDVVMRHHALGAVIGQRQQRAAVGHHVGGTARHRGEREHRDVHGVLEILERGVGIAAAKLILVGIADGVDHEVQLAPLLLQRVEHRVDGGFVTHVARQHDGRAGFLRQRTHALLQRLTQIGEGQLGPLGAARLGDAPGDGAVVGDAHDETLFAGHQGSGSGHAILFA